MYKLKTEILPPSYRETIISVNGKLILIKPVFQKVNTQNLAL